MKPKQLVPGVVMLAALLAACGGGSGDSQPPPSVQLAAITSANQDAVARASLAGGLGVGGSGNVVTSSSQAAALYGVRRVVPYARSARADVARPLIVSTATEPCAVSGSVTVSFDDRDNNGFSAGDILSLAFNQCRDTATSLATGAVSFTVNSVAVVNSSQLAFSATLAFQQLTIVEDQHSVSINGSVTAEYDETLLSVSLNLFTGASGLAATAAGPGYNDTLAFDAGFEFRYRHVFSTAATAGTVTTSINGTFFATSVGGRVTLATPVPFTKLSTERYPRIGQLQITGANNARLRITVIDATQVRIELDANGDGTYESMKVVPWNAILP